MPYGISNASAQQAQKSQGWSWNPFQDVAKVTSGIGGWINEHTSGPGFNSGIGSLITFAPSAVAGLGQLAVKEEQGLQKGLTANKWHDLAETNKQAAGAIGQGVGNTIADLDTLGGLAPWTQQFNKGFGAGVKKLSGGRIDYTPKTAKEMAGEPGGPGLGGAIANDALNLMVGAGAVAKVAKLGEIGEAGQAVRVAGNLGKTEATIKTGSTLEDIGNAGKAARMDEIARRAAAIAERTGEDAGTVASKITSRAKFLDRVEVVHNASETAMNPWRAFRGSVGSLGRAASALDHGVTEPDAASPGVVQGVSGEAGLPEAGRIPLTAIKEGNGLRHEVTPLTGDEPPIVLQEHGGELRVVEGNHRLEAARRAGAPDIAYTLEKAPNQIGGLEGMLKTKEAPPAPTPEGAPNERIMSTPTAKEQQLYNYYSTDVPQWAKTVAGKVPNWMAEGLKWIDRRQQTRDLSRVIRENERMVAKEVARVSNHPAIQAAVNEAEGLLGKMTEGSNHPIDVSAAVGERIAAAISARPLWDALESRRGATEAAAPGFTERVLLFNHKLPPEVNTPEFRASITHVADEIHRLTGSARDTLLESRMGTKGLEGINSVEAKLTKKGSSRLREAAAKEQKAVDQRTKMEAVAEKVRQETTGTADAEFAVARNMREAASQSRVAARAGEAGPFETPQARLEWANKLGEMADERVVRAKASIAQLDDNIKAQMMPFQQTIAALKGESGKLLDKVAAELEDPSIARTPHVFKPLVDIGNKMAEEARDNPELAEIVADLPKTFGQALTYAIDNGFDPGYVADMTPNQMRSLLRGTARLGSDESMGKGAEFTSGARRESRAILRRTGQVDRRIEALVAGIVRATHEDRTNHVIDYMERVIGKPMPVMLVNGQQTYVRPPNWTEWSPERKRMLGITDVKTGETTLGRVVQGQPAPLMIPTAAARLLRRYTNDFDNPFSRAMVKITNPWRALVLTLSPKFYLAHIAGHLTLATVAGATRLSDWAKAWEAAKTGVEGRVRYFSGKGFAEQPQLLNQSIMQDIGREPSLSGYKNTAAAAKEGGLLEASHHVAQRLHNIVATTDSFARAAIYFSQLRKGADEMTAMHYASDAAVDYQDLSSFEQKIVKSVIPFYGFQKGILKIATRLPLDHPATAALFMAMQRLNHETSTDSNGNPLPEAYLNTVGAFGTNIDLKGFNPFKDTVSLTTPEGIVSSLQFAVQALVRSGLGAPAPGTQAQGVKVNDFGQTVPNVPLLPQLAAAISNAPQAKLATDPARLLGLKQYTQAQLDKAGQQNVISEAQAALPIAEQKKAAAAGTAVSQATMLKALGGTVQNKPIVAPPSIDSAKLNAALSSYATQQTEKKAASIQAGKTAPSRKSTRRRLSVRKGHRGGSTIHFKRTRPRRISRGAVRTRIHKA